MMEITLEVRYVRSNSIQRITKEFTVKLVGVCLSGSWIHGCFYINLFMSEIFHIPKFCYL